MNPKIEETITIDFVTSSPTTGAAIDADTTPTCEVFEDANDTAILIPTVTKRAGKTGDYRIAIPCTAANGFEAGKSYNVIVLATVATVAAKAVARSFQVRVYSIDDVMAAAMDKTGFSLTAAYDPAKTAAQAGVAVTLTSVYDPAKAAASQSSVNAIEAKTGNLPSDPADASDIAASFVAVNGKLDAIDDSVDIGVGAIKIVTDKLDTALEPDGAVYRYTANALEQAPASGGGGSGDPWLTDLPGSYAAGTAGRIVGDNLDAPVNSRAPGTIFTGMTSIGQWLGLIAGKQAGNTAARDEIRATGVGSGTYDETTHSQEAIRDHGDEAWLGTGGLVLTAVPNVILILPEL